MVKPVTYMLPKTLNGVGSFIQPCKKITLRYCNWGGSSKGMREFVRTGEFAKFAEKYPKVQFELRREPGHPVVKGDFINGRDKVICVRNMEPQKIKQKLTVLRDSSGERLKYYNKGVESVNESVRGIWSPFHVDPKYRFKI